MKLPISQWAGTAMMNAAPAAHHDSETNGARGRAPHLQPGMTLVEMAIALAILTIVLAGALTFLQSQTRAFTVGNERMARLQSYRFAANVLEKDLRTVGAGVPGHQPFLVYAGDDVVAFNADYISHVAHDPFSVDWDTAAPHSMTKALTKAQRMRIPRSDFYYPDTTYLASGTNSPAETIIFFFEQDPEAEDENLHILYRQVNEMEPEIVARNLRRTDGKPFFTYLRPVSTGGAARLDSIPAASMPLRHSVRIHQSATDTGQVALIDQVRGIRLTFAASTRSGAGMGESVISRIVHLPNAGLAATRTCGGAPILGFFPDAAVELDPDTDLPLVVVSWVQAVDEKEGEKDVSRYVVWRRKAGQIDWGEPIESLKSGEDDYFITDTKNLVPGDTYEYGVAAQDCTPMLSSIASSNSITIPFP